MPPGPRLATEPPFGTSSSSSFRVRRSPTYHWVSQVKLKNTVSAFDPSSAATSVLRNSPWSESTSKPPWPK
jgi:hypothetical protein